MTKRSSGSDDSGVHVHSPSFSGSVDEATASGEEEAREKDPTSASIFATENASASATVQLPPSIELSALNDPSTRREGEDLASSSSYNQVQYILTYYMRYV